jgi:hypothetical protein
VITEPPRQESTETQAAEPANCGFHSA